MTDGTDAQILMNQIILEFMKEQKRKRRFRWFMRIILLILVIYLVFKFTNISSDAESKLINHVGMIAIDGEIGESEAVSADDFAKAMDAAYNNKGLKALILRINSPGGSPVQADYMFNLIQYYRAKNKDIPIYAVCVDICASAAYYVAVSANEIYANPSSLIGSIGVVFNGFGFPDVMQKVGVTRRLYTAGKNKGFLDPFSPIDETQVAKLQAMLDTIHNTFIEKVKMGRGNKLVVNDDIFSGLFWTGIRAKELGLIDGFASSGQLARDKIKLDKIIEYTVKKSVFDRFSKSFHSAMISPYQHFAKVSGKINM